MTRRAPGCRSAAALFLVASIASARAIEDRPVAACLPRAEPSLSDRFAPDFALRSVTGETVRLSALRGRAVVLNFWATWCQPCRVETPWLVDLDRRYRARGLEIVGVSLDDPGAEVAKFVRENRVSYPILLDGKSIAAEYGGARYLPQTILIDGKGRVVDSLSGLERRNVLENRVRRLLRDDGRS